MFHRKTYYVLILFLLTLAIIMGGIIYYSQNSKDLKVIFLDIGQGDAILIEQGNNQLLVDGGRNGKALLEKLGKYIPFWDRQIETIVATHPDADHIGGLVNVLKTYNVKTVIKTKAESESQTYKAMMEAIKQENADYIEAINGIKIKFADNVSAEVIYPLGSVETADPNASNENSVALVIATGANKFLTAGDLPVAQEEILDIGKINFLKVSHHGSKYSTSDKFLDDIKPEEAIISVGKNNSYGHPAPEIIQRLLSHGIKIWRTDEMGDIVYECNPALAGQSAKCEVEF
jgi:competence protein ComEC